METELVTFSDEQIDLLVKALLDALEDYLAKYDAFMAYLESKGKK